MRLIQFTYRGDDWRLALPVNLQEVNLLVGKNAVGKSKTVRALGNVLLYLMQLSERISVSDIFRCKLLFEDKDGFISYEFQLSKSNVVYESLTANGETRCTGMRVRLIYVVNPLILLPTNSRFMFVVMYCNIHSLKR